MDGQDDGLDLARGFLHGLVLALIFWLFLGGVVLFVRWLTN